MYPSRPDPVPDQIAAAVDALIRGDEGMAVATLKAIDTQALLRARSRALAQAARARGGAQATGEPVPRASIGTAVARQVFQRDGYVCCYCRRRTIDSAVLRALSTALPQAFPFHPRWRFGDAHLVYWTHTASLEHGRPVAGGGSNDLQNLRTACYLCNDAKCDRPLDALGWSLRPPGVIDPGWKGLTDRLEGLNRVAAARTAVPGDDGSQAGRRSQPQRPETSGAPWPLSEGNLIRARLPGKRSSRQYRVDRVTSTSVTLREMWREWSSGTWVASRRTHTLDPHDLDAVVLVRHSAPDEG